MFTRWNTGWNELDDMFSAIHQLRQHMDRVIDDRDEGPLSGYTSSFGGNWPRVNLRDTGTSLVLTAEVPELTDKDVRISLHQDVITLRGERSTQVPEGYSVHRQERPSLQFSRSFGLPCSVNPDRASALVKDGILTVTLEKATEAMPRQITVKAH